MLLTVTSFAVPAFGADLQLRGVVYVSDPSQLQDWPADATIGVVDTTRIDFLDAGFIAKTSPFLGQPFTTDLLKSVINMTVEYAREQGRPLVQVRIPEQDVSSGVLQVLVQEAKLGEVRVEGAEWFSPDVFTDNLTLEPGQPIHADQLQADLNWLRENPFRDIDPIYAPGTEAGTTDVILRVADRRPFRVFTSLNNSGSPQLDKDQWSAGFMWGDVFGLDHLMTYQWSSSVDGNSYHAHAFSYNIPLPWRHNLLLTAGFSKSRATLLNNLFDQKGESVQLAGRYRIPLPDISNLTVNHNLSVGMDFKKINSDLAFGGTSVFNSTPEIYQLALTHTLAWRDSWGNTSLANSFFYSPGGLDNDNNKDDYELARAGADPNYWYFRGDINRSFDLPYAFQVSLNVSGQYSPDRLLSSERFIIGGMQTVRGFEESALSGDAGLNTRLEIIMPAISLFDMMGVNEVQDSLNFYVFGDHGFVHNQNHTATEDGHQSIGSIGVGMRYRLSNYMSAEIAYGRAIHDLPGNPEQPVYFSLSAGF